MKLAASKKQNKPEIVEATAVDLPPGKVVVRYDGDPRYRQTVFPVTRKVEARFARGNRVQIKIYQVEESLHDIVGPGITGISYRHELILPEKGIPAHHDNHNYDL
jgi:hypothetical protein